MFSTIIGLIALYLIIGIAVVYVNREDKLNNFRLGKEHIKPILTWYTIFKKDKSV